MSDNIDYDELDRAIAESQKLSAAKSAPKARSTSASTPKKAKTTTTATPKPAPKPAAVPVRTTPVAQVPQQSFPPRRRVYMDFIGRPRNRNNEAESLVRLKAQAAEEKQAPRRVAHFATATPGMPNYRTANSHKIATSQATMPKPIMRKATPAPVTRVQMTSAKPVAQAKPAPAPVAKAAPIIKPVAKPVIKPVAAEPKPIAPHTPSATAVAAAEVVKSVEEGPKAPNANNYSIGVRSPYIRNDAKVSKRPLNGDVSEYVQDDKIEKNSYPEKPIKASSQKKARSKHTVKKNEKSNSSWYWPILVVLIVAAGGGIGYLLWWILQGAS